MEENDGENAERPAKEEPRGTLMLRSLAMPAEANPNGDVCGGRLMAEMDAGGAMMAAEMARGRVVTVAVGEIAFLRPVHVGDVVCVYGEPARVGTTSLAIRVQLWAKPGGAARSDRIKVADTVVTYVAVDADGVKRKLPAELREHPEKYLYR